MKVLISDNLAPVGAQILKDAGLEVDINVGLTPEELKKEIPKYDGLVIRSATKVTEEILEAAENLKVVGRAGIGIDQLGNGDPAFYTGIDIQTPCRGETAKGHLPVEPRRYGHHQLCYVEAGYRDIKGFHLRLPYPG